MIYAPNFNNSTGKIYLSVWSVSVEKQWKILPFVFFKLPSNNNVNDYAQHNRQFLIEKFKEHISEEDIESYMQFYHDEFRKENCYSFSSIVSYKFLYEDDKDIVLYPSVKEEAKGNNYAFNKKWIKNKTLICRKVYRLSLEKKDDIYDVVFEAEGTPVNNNVKW